MADAASSAGATKAAYVMRSPPGPARSPTYVSSPIPSEKR